MRDGNPAGRRYAGHSIVGFGLDIPSADESSWQDDALCNQTDPEAFFPEKGGSTRAAKRVCAACSVRERCLQEALDNGETFGIWGGLSERERRALRREGVA